MKAGILTYHFSDNYGALFQAYGLRTWLLNRGILANFINYHPAYVEEGGHFDRPWNPALWRKNCTILYMKLTHHRGLLMGNSAQQAAFEDFRALHLGVSSERLRRAEDLAPAISDYDMLICGSDQIWNPSIQRGLDPVYFLDIPGVKQVHKVAYAPSFGRSTIEPEHHAELQRLLKGLNAISVREVSGLNILEQAGLSRGTAQVLPDPTILLGQFDNLLEGDTTSDNSVFCYALRTDELIREVANVAAKIYGATLLAPRNNRQRWPDIGVGVVPGPMEWLHMLARARLVVSNSFHGIALSVVLNKPFISVKLTGKRAKLNARTENLLKLLGLPDRIIDTSNTTRIRELVETPVEWGAVNRRMKKIRERAEAYLDTEITKAKANAQSVAKMVKE